MIFYQFLVERIGDTYYNFEVVSIAFFFLIFILVLTALNRNRALGKNRGVNIVISFVISLIGAFYLRRASFELTFLNFLIVIVVLGVVFFVVKPFMRFFRKQF